jgi:hypothetical protein
MEQSRLRCLCDPENMIGTRGVPMDFRLTDTYFAVDHVRILPVMAFLLLTVIPFWAIFRKTGFSGALSLLMLVPGVNLILLYVVAFSRKRGPLSSN